MTPPQLDPLPDPLVTIAIPTFNRAHLLPRAISSARAQRHEHVEIVIGDNGSTDGTAEVVAAAMACDDRIRGERSTVNVGAVRNFHRLVDTARGDYFLWLADDDAISSDYVSTALARLRADPGLVCVAGRAVFVDAGGEVVRLEPPVHLAGSTGPRRVLRFAATVLGNSAFYGVVPTHALRAALRPSGLLAHDWKLVASLAAQGVVTTDPTATLTRADDGVSETMRRLVRDEPSQSLAGISPYTAIALELAAHVSSDPALGSLGPVRRRMLGATVFVIIAVRFWSRTWYRLVWLRWRRGR